MCNRNQCLLLPSEDEIFIRVKRTAVGEVFWAFPSAASILSPKEPKKSSPLKAIRKHCKACRLNMDGCSAESCPDEFCHLWPFRLGKRPENHGN